jgi:hypothetical protein
MYTALMKNKWPLLAFLVIMLAGLQMFVGGGAWTEPQQQQLAAPAAVASAPTVETPAEQPAEDMNAFYSGSDDADFEYVEDGELVDDTAGFDPTPEADEVFDEEDGGYGDIPDADDYQNYQAPASNPRPPANNYRAPPSQDQPPPPAAESYRG